jgi:hypothetical protein
MYPSLVKIKNLPPPSTTPATIIVTVLYGWKEVLPHLPPPSTGVTEEGIFD